MPQCLPGIPIDERKETSVTIRIEPSGASCGALVRGVDLCRPVPAEDLAAIRSAWLEHLVLAFPDQPMSIEDLERFSLAVGPRGEDPFIAPIPGHRHVVEIRREADEKTPLFAEGWHSDWSFLPSPPAGTALFGTIVPPVGGDTLFANQYAAYEALPDDMKRRLDGMVAIHSARRGYARDGLYGERDKGRSMAIIHSDEALRTRQHPLVRTHPETGRKALFVNPGYTIGIEGLERDEASALLKELFAHQVRPEFVYRHRWAPRMLVLWDNRCLLHAASGGYEGHRRLMHRITIGERAAA
jgi:taurine dioxygenase